MKFKSEHLTQASGSIGGVTYAHNRGGLYRRARSIPVNPSTQFQQEVRSILTANSSAWVNTLTAEQRSAWDAYALATPITNSIGNPVNVGGLGMFNRGNVPRIQAGLARVLDGPVTPGTPTFTEPTLAVSAAQQEATVTFDEDDSWASTTGAAMLVYISRPVSPARNYFRGPYRFAGAILGNGTTPPVSPAEIAVPFPVVAGQRVHVRIVVVDEEGRLSGDFRSPVSVLA